LEAATSGQHGNFFVTLELDERDIGLRSFSRSVF
jgi:hypothetical protein